MDGQFVPDLPLSLIRAGFFDGGVDIMATDAEHDVRLSSLLCLVSVLIYLRAISSHLLLLTAPFSSPMFTGFCPIFHPQ